MNLNNKVIIVTGGSGLLGQSIINHIKANGGTPINLDLINKDESIDFIKVDITEQPQIKNTFKEIYHKYQCIDGLVNNAYPRTKDWGISFEEDELLNSWRKNVDLQMNSYVGCCQEVIPYMKKQKSGAIVNMASIYGVVGNDFTIYENTNLKTAAPYAAIKGGLINITRYLASYFGKDNIRVNCVSPGGIFDHQNPVFVKNYEDKVPMRRMGEPNDIAPSVSFLLSDEAKYITGHNLIIDGGWTCI